MGASITNGALLRGRVVARRTDTEGLQPPGTLTA